MGRGEREKINKNMFFVGDNRSLFFKGSTAYICSITTTMLCVVIAVVCLKSFQLSCVKIIFEMSNDNILNWEHEKTDCEFDGQKRVLDKIKVIAKFNQIYFKKKITWNFLNIFLIFVINFKFNFKVKKVSILRIPRITHHE